MLITRKNSRLSVKDCLGGEKRDNILTDRGVGVYPVNSYETVSCPGDSGGIYSSPNGTIEGINIGVSSQKSAVAIKPIYFVKLILEYIENQKK